MNAAKRCLILLVALLLPVLAGCGGSGGGSSGTGSLTNGASLGPPISTRDEAKSQGAWTVLIYLDADNDLEAAGITNFNQMELVGSTRDVRIVVQMDRIRGYDSSNGDWTDARRYLVTRDGDPSEIRSLRLDDVPLGEVDMGDWRTLRDFVEWGVREFPAQHYCLVIWDHGTGWQMRTAGVPQYKYIASDETSGTGMNVTDIPRALAGVRIDVLAFDACLMQQIEVAYELRNSACYMVGSASSEPSPGYNYSAWLSRIGAGTTPADLARVIVEEYARAYPPPRKAITQCAVDLGMMNDLARAASSFAEVMITAGRGLPQLKQARETAVNYSTADGGANRHYLDLMDYATQCTDALGLDAQDAYQTLKSALGAAVVAESHNPSLANSYGIGIYVPPPGSYDYRYGWLSFAVDTAWDEWIRAQLP